MVNAIRPFDKIILDRNALVEIVLKHRNEGKKIVTTNGCFDLLHVGHVRYIFEASRFGDIMIVAINSDDSVKRLKGDSRPIVSELDRAEMIASLGCVDYVTIFDEDTPIPLLERIRPDIHVKGGNYRLEQLLERETVERCGGKVIVGIEVKGKSTTDIINSILAAYGVGGERRDKS